MGDQLLGARIAVLNWRDRDHPEAGGAEEYAWRIGAHLRAAGAYVTFVTARAEGQLPRELVDGIEVVRAGGRWTVYPRVLRWLAANRTRIDLVLDCQNGIPFFAPLAATRRTPVVLVMHHVHDAQFGVHFPGPVAAFGRWLEGPAARRVYRRGVATAVSPSTVEAMRERLGWTGPVYVIPNGLDPVRAAGRRAATPTIVSLGRLVTHKRADRLAAAMRELPHAHLHIVGRGPAEDDVRKAAGPNVTVHGYVDEATKARLLGEAWLHVNLSDGEGWGIAVLEAASAGLPTLCRDVDGLRDSVRPGRTGWLIGENAGMSTLVDALDGALTELADPDRAASVGRECRDWAARFDWAATGTRTAELVSLLLRDRRPTAAWADQHPLAAPETAETAETQAAP